MREEIVIPIYFQQKDDGKVIIDIEGITDEFNNKLNEIIENPQKFLEI